MTWSAGEPTIGRLYSNFLVERLGAVRTGKLFSAAILEDYSHTLNELREVGYITYARQQLSPYLRACVDQFSRQQRSVTERLIERILKN